ncbi:MAG: hypothetical protein Q9220_007621 [cf. Caloplaca sp. 1 TL-2023]
MISTQPEPIAIVGSGCRFPGGATSPSSLWHLLQSPRDVSQDITDDRFNAQSIYHPNGLHHGTTNVQQAYLLQEDICLFDAAFFNISPTEADSMDPQQRLLLETVYEALEAGGHTIESLRGSDTAVYTGTMSVDYNDTLVRDVSTVPIYTGTGMNRAIISNRVSYFFDWHGPSMTIDTACSSSLIAVHQAVTALRAGESRVAVACGTQIILEPEAFIVESKLGMLSPTNRSRMWDAEADGYARGEGTAAIVLKRLSDAIADGDYIECLIRATGANQDGFSAGLTVPNSEAQAALIRQTYARAGLDPTRPEDRPQFFEAHGTGTKAGDPREAAAIQSCFGMRGEDGTPLYVGSVKTVIGHTEGAAGLAGILKGSGIIQKGIIPPNLLFDRLAPAVEPYYDGLHVPTVSKAWPRLPPGVPRRVSVNSFGFGGSNAHAILEQFRNNTGLTITESQSPEPRAHRTPVTPFVFSAVSDASLANQLQAYSEHLKTHGGIDTFDLAWTLQYRRSHFPFRTAFSAATVEQLTFKIDQRLGEVKQGSGVEIGARAASKSTVPRILGVFTGQGAQWAAMGEQLVRSSDDVREKFEALEESLATLPPEDRPRWHLLAELLVGDAKSRISEAELSQPLCTAVQIVLVDLLKVAGITFSAVVGHSSGEIAAAYAAGFFSARDAIRIAYYRGVHASQAGSPSSDQKGAMLAVGTSWEDAQDLVNLRAFKGRLAIAAHNSSASITLSGDADAVILAKKVFDEEKKFARLLKVDTAYHSHHMLPCGDPYIRSLQACGIKIKTPGTAISCSWFSSVFPKDKATVPGAEFQDIYWRDNMTNAVLFAEAIQSALASDLQLTLALEVGPHPALRGPALQNSSEVRSVALPYCGTLQRGTDDIQAFSDALGFVWTHAGAERLDFRGYEKVMSTTSSGIPSQPTLLVGLPSYRFSHTRRHWHESRRSKKMRTQGQAFHELLGAPSPDSTANDMRWTNVLKVSEIPWLEGHQLQGQIVFPAAAHVALALEAARSLVADRSVELYELHDLTIPKAIVFDDSHSFGVETLTTLTAISSPNTNDQHHGHSSTTTTTAEFSCYASAMAGPDSEMELKSRATLKIVFGLSSVEALSSTPLETSSLAAIDVERFYTSIFKIGYHYASAFRAMSSMKRRLGRASAMVSSYPYTEADVTRYLVHPTYLDVAIQTTMLAYSAPGDDRLWSLHMPTSMGSIRINPELCNMLPLSGTLLPVCTILDDTEIMSANIDIFNPDGQQAMVQIEGLAMKPFAPATEADDRRLFSHTKWDYAAPNPTSIVRGARPSSDEIQLANVCERIAYYYLRKWKAEISDDEWTNGQSHYRYLRDHTDRTLSAASGGRLSWLKEEWLRDTPDDIEQLINRYQDNIDIKLLAAVGKNVPAAVRNETTILEHMLPDNMLERFYANGIGAIMYNSFLASILQQLTHRYPHAKMIEIGAGTGGATKSILKAVGNAITSYTYTDLSMGFLNQAAETFEAYGDKLVFKVLDIEKPPATQGLELHSYDVVIASNVLHATSSLKKTLEHTRQLLKPGGYLVMLELTNNQPLRHNTVMGGLPGWWLGVHEGRTSSALISAGEWHSVLKKTGFSGIDAITPEIDPLTWPVSVLLTQAVDDRVQLLRRPLGHHSTSVYIDSLVILGGRSLVSAQIVEQLEERLESFCGQMTVLDDLPTEHEAQALNPMCTFINLVDIDSPIFKCMTTEKMDGLKRVFELAKTILWVTVGALTDEPYHQASIGFSRTMAHEAAYISLNHLDLSSLEHNASQCIAEHLLRQCILDELATGDNKQGDHDLLWSRENEMFINRGQMMVPRLVDNKAQNARLNSSRRPITKTVPLTDSHLSVASSAVSPLAVTEKPLTITSAESTELVRVECSSLMALHIAAGEFLFLAKGKHMASHKDLLILSINNSCEVEPAVHVDMGRSGDTQHASSLVVAVASELLASSLLEDVSSGSRILVHCSNQDRFLAAALTRQATAKKVFLALACDTQYAQGAQIPGCIAVNARMPKYALRKLLLPFRPTQFLDITTISRDGPNELGLRMAEVLPFGCRPIDHSRHSRRQASIQEPDNTEIITKRLETAFADVRMMSTSSVPDQTEDLLIQLTRVPDSGVASNMTSVICWPLEADIVVKVRPLDVKGLFSQDKAYLLVGLTGELGRSACEWMVSQGAGHVYLTSRDPMVDEKWLESFEESGATVKAIPMDVTNKRSVESVVAGIQSTGIPICGVINGAMVLRDSLFSNMTIDQMQQVLGPKIDGTNNLDEVFYNDRLDFFIMFSSAACVIGNPGQANYTAANGYINSFARKRRARGLAASTIDIGQVAGIGYVENARSAVRAQLTKLGMMAISEPEYHQMLAETIVAGVPMRDDHDTGADAVITTGIRMYQEDEDLQGSWVRSPRFSHRVIKTKDVGSQAEDASKKTMLPVREQLTRVKSTEQGLEILIVLQMRDSKLEPDMPLIELGVDSLIAVEVRSWFLKELKVDIPVLKVVGGATVLEICQTALEKLPQDLLASSEQQPVSSQQQPVSSKEPPVKPFVAVSGGVTKHDSASSGSPVSDGPSDSTASSTNTTTASGPTHLEAGSQKLSPVSEPARNQDKSSRKFIKSESLSFGQSRFWFLGLLLEDQTTFNVAFYYRVNGHLRLGDLEKAVRTVGNRHEALRTCFVADPTEPDQAYQKVLSSSPLRLEHREIQSKEDVAVQFAKEKAYPFDIANGETIRVVLLSLSPSSHYLLINYHHILMDGSSLNILLAELEKTYNGESLGRPPLQFPSISAAQRRAWKDGQMNDELRYWKGVFPPGEQVSVLPLLPMAHVSARTPMKTHDIHQVQCRLDARLATQLKSVAKAQRSTAFHLYLAAYKTMLFCLTDAQDLSIGVADAARNDNDVMGSIGFFLNLLPLQFHRQDDQSFADAISEARDITYAALKNSRLPFDVLLKEFNVARTSTHSPFFQAFFDWHGGIQEKQFFGNCQFEMLEASPGRSPYDITLDVTENAVDAVIIIRVQKALYDLTAANFLLETFVHFLDILCHDKSISLSAVPLYSDKHRTHAQNLGSDQVALMDGDGKVLTYSDMVSRIQTIAKALVDFGSGADSRVLVFQQATTDWVCCMLAIMRCGATYVPLDLRNPLSRLAAIADDCQPSAVLVDGTSFSDAHQLNVPKAVIIDTSALPTGPSKWVSNTARADSTAAILYTSGSTGTPKGIMVTHSGLRNEIEGYTKTWKLGAERVLQQSAFTFNHSSDQMYTGLVNGGLVYIVPWSKRGDPLEISKLVHEQSITYTKATPSEYSLWMQYGGDNLRQAKQWRHAFGGGESLSSIVISQFADLNLPQLRFFNSYGPTEISISSHKMEVEYRDQQTLGATRVPCGYSLPNYTTYVLDEHLRPLPVGIPGEIYIGGAGVSQGYLNNAELTAQHFVPNPYAGPEYTANGWTRMYRTGDIGHMQDDGAMVFHRRMEGDTQVKIRGLRLELSDIERNIVSTAGGVLREAIVTFREGDPDFLAAHVVFRPQHGIADKEGFLDQLLGRLPLPQYMIPVAAIPLDNLPLTNHSKVDRKAIQRMPLTQRVRSLQSHEEMNEMMMQLQDVWHDVLGNQGLDREINPSTSFFFIGGNSLLIIRLQSRIRKKFHVEIPLVELIGANTLREMVRKIEESFVADAIDWEKETTPPFIPSLLLPRSSDTQARRSSTSQTVLITGSTGFLAKYILPQLVDNPLVSTIHCVAIRSTPSQEPGALFASSKITLHTGDLTAPLLGLSETTFQSLSREVDTILHLGAARSFWDSYHVLRPSSVQSTIELIKLASPNRIPIHYVSTIGVLPPNVASTATSAAAFPPRTDGSNGYVATKWASERTLERSTAELGVPVSIYRFLPTASKQDDDQTRILLEELDRFVTTSGKMPDFTGWQGRLDMLPAEEAATWMCSHLLDSTASDHHDNESGDVLEATTRFIHRESAVAVTVEEMSAYLIEKRGGSEIGETMPALKWFGLIKKLGFAYLVTGQEGSIGGEGGVRYEMRR